MRRIYSYLVVAFVMMTTSFQASAELSVTFQWNNPGSVDLYVGGTGTENKVNLHADATQHTAVMDNTWGASYVYKRPGYEISSVTCEGEAIYPMSNGNYRIDMPTYDGKIVVIQTEVLVYDGTFSINVVNGRDAISATMWGSGREISLKTGLQNITYSTKYETGIDIQAPVAGSEDPYLKQGTSASEMADMEWKAYYGWDTNLYHKYNGTSIKGFAFVDGEYFEVKYCNTPDEAPVVIETAHISFNFSNDEARSALTMVRNQTQNKSIYDYLDGFDVNVGDVVRLNFNSRDFTITVDGETLTPAPNSTYINYEFTADADRTLNISVAERDYGTTTIQIAIADINGVELREGSFNGPIIDITAVTPLYTTTYSYEDFNSIRRNAELSVYSFEVSLKSPKVYVTEAKGWWFSCCEYKVGSDIFPGRVAGEGYTLMVDNRQINADTKVVIYLAAERGKNIEEIILRDRNRNFFQLAAGYNEIMIDTDYASPISFGNYSDNDSEAFSVYQNMIGISLNSDSNLYDVSVNSDCAIHVFAARPAANQHTLSVYCTPDANDVEVIVDRVRKVTPGSSFSLFTNSEISVTPGNNRYILGGEVEEFVGQTHTFICDRNFDDVVKMYFGEVEKTSIYPAENQKIEEFAYIEVTFPNATDVVVNEEYLNDIMVSDVAQSFYCCQSFNVNRVTDAGIPTFRIIPSNIPNSNGAYRIVIPEGLFTVQEDFISAGLESTFEISKPLISSIQYKQVEQLDLSSAVRSEEKYTGGKGMMFCTEVDGILYALSTIVASNGKTLKAIAANPREDGCIYVSADDGHAHHEFYIAESDNGKYYFWSIDKGVTYVLATDLADSSLFLETKAQAEAAGHEYFCTFDNSTRASVRSHRVLKAAADGSMGVWFGNETNKNYLQVADYGDGNISFHASPLQDASSKSLILYYSSDPNGNISGTEAVETVEESEIIFYNLQGVRVEHPKKGIYIRHEGNKTSKVIVK